MARPTKFNLDRGEVIVGALLAGEGRRAAVKAAGVGLRTLAEWLAKGRAGDPALVEWVRQVELAEGVANRVRCCARYEREEAEAKERWQRFKRQRIQYHRDQLGGAEFWRRRFQWLAEHGYHRSYAQAVQQLQTEGFRISAGL